MKTIWKFTLKPDTITHLEMPKEAKILTVQAQNNDVCMWAIVDTDNAIEERKFEIYGTGHNLPEAILHQEYIGTLQLYNGTLVFHLFER